MSTGKSIVKSMYYCPRVYYGLIPWLFSRSGWLHTWGDLKTIAPESSQSKAKLLGAVIKDTGFTVGLRSQSVDLYQCACKDRQVFQQEDWLPWRVLGKVAVACGGDSFV